MRITLNSNRTFRLRIAQVIALSAVVALAACQDVTAPEKAVSAGPALRLSQAVTDELGSLGASLDDMTAWSLVALPDAEGKTKIVELLAGLKTHLASGEIAACQQDVVDGRTILGALSPVEQVEVGAVGVTLDVIQSALDKASQ